MQNILTKESKVILHANGVLGSSNIFLEEFRLEYKKLLKSFEKSNKRLMSIVKLGDRQQQQMNELNEELEVANRRLNTYLQIINKNVIISTTDLKGNITYVSDAFCHVFGYKKEFLLGKKHSILKHPDTEDSLYKDMWSTILSGKSWRGEIKNYSKDKKVHWLSLIIEPNFDLENKVVSFTSVREDITDKKLIEEMSITDVLTTLYNRRYFNTMIAKELKRAKRAKNELYFIMLDIDFFKQYNDTYGHQAGDEALKSVALKLKEMFNRGSDFVFRLGGEEFGVIVSNSDFENVISFAKRVCKEIENIKIEHKKNSVSSYLTISMGITRADSENRYDENLTIKTADDALYLAKEGGRNRVKFLNF